MTTLVLSDYYRDLSLGDATDPRHPLPPVTPWDILCLAEIRRRDPDEAMRLATQAGRQADDERRMK